MGSNPSGTSRVRPRPRLVREATRALTHTLPTPPLWPPRTLRPCLGGSPDQWLPISPERLPNSPKNAQRGRVHHRHERPTCGSRSHRSSGSHMTRQNHAPSPDTPATHSGPCSTERATWPKSQVARSCGPWRTVILRSLSDWLGYATLLSGRRRPWASLSRPERSQPICEQVWATAFWFTAARSVSMTDPQRWLRCWARTERRPTGCGSRTGTKRSCRLVLTLSSVT